MTLLRRAYVTFLVAYIAGSLSAASPVGQKSPEPPAEGLKLIWHAPPPMTASDWYWGPGGKEQAPVSPFQFLKEDLNGTSPKVKVQDARGATWTVKFGHEVHSDTFAPRVAYAAGYFVEPTYFVREGVIQAAHDLKRAKPFISRTGKFQYARFKKHDEDALGKAEDYGWSWRGNPFAGSHELNGLKVVMLLTSNWDGKDATDKTSNTSVFFRKADTAYLYVFTDWGSTMGKWGGYFTRDKWDCSGYAGQTRKLVKGVKGDQVVWGFSGKHMQDLTQGIHVDDVRWIVPYLSRFTDDQISEGLAASGASPEQIKTFTRAVQERIHELEQISSSPEVSSKRP